MLETNEYNVIAILIESSPCISFWMYFVCDLCIGFYIFNINLN